MIIRTDMKRLLLLALLASMHTFAEDTALD